MGAGPGTVSQVKNTLKLLKEDDSVVGVLLVLDTPGGGVTASDRIYHDLSVFKKESKLPIHSIFLDVSASGGYYIAMASDHITAHPTTVTGSIGVISKFYNFSQAMDKVGVSVNVVKSLNSEGEVSFKDIGSPYRPMRPEERELLQGLITEMWDQFTEVVATGREGKLTPEEVRKLADGRVFTGEQALQLKLVDSVGYTEDAYAKIREAAGHQEAKIVAYRKEPGLAELLGFSAQAHEPALETLSVAKEVLSHHSGFLYLWTAGSL
jgi:protease-4